MTRWIVVGGGAAGCVVAARLADGAGNDVTLLEAGEATGPRAASASSLADLASPGAVWDGGYVRGRGLGGSSRINGGVLSGEVPDWLPTETPADDELGPLDRALLAAAPEATRALLGRREGRFVSAADVLAGTLVADVLPGDAHRHRTSTATTVMRVLIDGRRAVAVELADGTTVEGDRVVLCAGAIGTPLLLERSGVRHAGLGAVTDHAGRVIEIELRAEVDHASLVTGAVLRTAGVELVPLNHVGAGAPGRAALLVGWLRSPRRGRVTPGGGVAWEPLDGCAAAGLRSGVGLAVDVLRTQPFRHVVADFTVPPALDAYYHACGTCRSVVDATGKVKDVDHLYVADASTLALPPSGPLGPVLAHADRFARARASGP
jgi:choline dehydrogenase-like flavoprotein